MRANSADFNRARNSMDMDNYLQQPTSRPNDGGGDDGIVPADTDSLTPSRLLDSLPGDDVAAPFSSIEGYLLGSFMPGVADFSTPGFGDGLDFSGGVQDWAFYQEGGGYHGAV